MAITQIVANLDRQLRRPAMDGRVSDGSKDKLRDYMAGSFSTRYAAGFGSSAPIVFQPTSPFCADSL